MNDINVENALSFEPPLLLIDRFCRENEVPDVVAREQFRETLKFLVICALERDRHYSPGPEVDKMWHEFLLFSRDYFAFCEMLGGYLHHQPSDDTKKGDPHMTFEALRRVFGDVNPSYWGKSAANCCSSCSN
jgi:hypothetical protein